MTSGSWDGVHCSVHGAQGYGQYTKNGHCSLCPPPQPITKVEQVIDLLEVQIERNKEWPGLAEQFKNVLDYIKKENGKNGK